MLLKTETHQTQSTLAQYCRDGKTVKIPGTNVDRLPHYRRLVYNVIQDSLSSAFPVANSYIDEIDWGKMMYQFFSEHKCSTPQIWKLPFEFYEFAIQQDFAQKYKVPFLIDLLYFEWLEIEVYMMEDRTYPEHSKTGNWFEDQIIFNPEYKLVKFEYPVHLKRPSDINEEKGAYFLLLFREKESGKVQFVNLSVLYTFLIEQLETAEKSLNEILVEIIYLFGINDEKLLREKVVGFLENQKTKGFIVGFAS